MLYVILFIDHKLDKARYLLPKYIYCLVSYVNFLRTVRFLPLIVSLRNLYDISYVYKICT